MNRLIFDLETDAKTPDSVSRIWCLAVLDPETGCAERFGPHQLALGVQKLATAAELIGHNVSAYDLPILARLCGLEYKGRVVDTLILSRLLFNGLSDEPDRYGRHALAAWGKRLDCLKGDFQQFDRWSPEMADYCEQDCRVTDLLVKRLRASDPSPASVNLELRYAAFLRRIEKHGFQVRLEGVRELTLRIARRLEPLRRRLDVIFPPKVVTGKKPAFWTLALTESRLFDIGEIPEFKTKGEAETWRKSHGLKPRQCKIEPGPLEQRRVPFNPSSPKQVIEGLQSLGWQPEAANSNGALRTDKMTLWHSGLVAGKLIVAHRSYSKLVSYAEGWRKHCRDGRLHPHFQSNMAATNRSSCTSPNLQNIPSAKKPTAGLRRAMSRYGQRCRALFGPRPGYVLVGSDLQGIEARLLGHRLAPFDGGTFAEKITDPAFDIHQENAGMLGISRDRAKTVLYGSMYGQGARSLAAQLKISKDEARAVIDGLTTGIEGFAEVLAALKAERSRDGRIELIDGRRLQVGSDHKCLNYAIQGDGATVTKHWALNACDRLGDSFRLIVVVHDELQGECLPDAVEAVKETLVRTATETGEQLGFRVRVDADAKHGSNWAETH
jgi:DNA polymerase-1